MNRRLLGVLTVVLLCACIPRAFAMGDLIVVTKTTEANSGLHYTLVAERVSKEVVLVRMQIPKEGKLKDLRSVSMRIGRDGTPLVDAPLQMRAGEKDSWVVSFQLSSGLADQCYVDMVTPSVPPGGMSYEVYAVELKGYVTDRK